MQAYCDIGFDGVLRPDHVLTMEGDSNDNPTYSSIGRLFAIGYVKAKGCAKPYMPRINTIPAERRTFMEQRYEQDWR